MQLDQFLFSFVSIRKEKLMYEGISEPVITTHGLAKSYGAVHALKALDIEIPRHSITGFLGANGAGKSTTIKLLLGLLKPTAGSGSIFNMDIVKNSPQIRRTGGISFPIASLLRSNDGARSAAFYCPFLL
jgi:ABC-type multidrug transport system ATPase subunit